MGAGTSTAASCSSLDIRDNFGDKRQAIASRLYLQQQRPISNSNNNNNNHIKHKQSNMRNMQRYSSSHFDLTTDHLINGKNYQIVNRASGMFDDTQAEGYTLSNANLGNSRPIKVLPSKPVSPAALLRHSPRKTPTSAGIAGKIQQHQRQNRFNELKKFSDSLPSLVNAPCLDSSGQPFCRPIHGDLHHSPNSYICAKQPPKQPNQLCYKRQATHHLVNHGRYPSPSEQSHRQSQQSHSQQQNRYQSKNQQQSQPNQMKRATSLSSLHNLHAHNQPLQRIHYNYHAEHPSELDIMKQCKRISRDFVISPPPLIHHRLRVDASPSPSKSPSHFVKKSLFKLKPSNNSSKLHKAQQKLLQKQQTQQQACQVLPSLPRSQSLHQLIQLRATENGQRMRTTGTLRGPLEGKNEVCNKVNLGVELLENMRQERFSKEQGQNSATVTSNSSRSSSDDGIHDVTNGVDQYQSTGDSTKWHDDSAGCKQRIFKKNAQTPSTNNKRFSQNISTNGEEKSSRLDENDTSKTNLKRSHSHSALNQKADENDLDRDGDESDDLNELARFLYKYNQRQESKCQADGKDGGKKLASSKTSNDGEKNGAKNAKANSSQQSPTSTSSSSGFASSTCTSNSIPSSSDHESHRRNQMQQPTKKKPASSKKYPAPRIPPANQSDGSSVNKTCNSKESRCLISGELKLSSSLLSIVDEYNSTLQHSRKSMVGASCVDLNDKTRIKLDSTSNNSRLASLLMAENEGEDLCKSTRLEELKRYTQLRQMSQSELALNHLTSSPSLASSANSPQRNKSSGDCKSKNKNNNPSGCKSPYKSRFINLIRRRISDKSEVKGSHHQAIDKGEYRQSDKGSERRVIAQNGSHLSSVGGHQQHQHQIASRVTCQNRLVASQQSSSPAGAAAGPKAINQTGSGSPLPIVLESDLPENSRQNKLLYIHETAKSGDDGDYDVDDDDKRPTTTKQQACNIYRKAQHRRLANQNNSNNNNKGLSESLCDLNFDCDLELIKKCGSTNELKGAIEEQQRKLDAKERKVHTDQVTSSLLDSSAGKQQQVACNELDAVIQPAKGSVTQPKSKTTTKVVEPTVSSKTSKHQAGDSSSRPTGNWQLGPTNLVSNLNGSADRDSSVRKGQHLTRASAGKANTANEVEQQAVAAAKNKPSDAQTKRSKWSAASAWLVSGGSAKYSQKDQKSADVVASNKSHVSSSPSGPVTADSQCSKKAATQKMSKQKLNESAAISCIDSGFALNTEANQLLDKLDRDLNRVSSKSSGADKSAYSQRVAGLTWLKSSSGGGGSDENAVARVTKRLLEMRKMSETVEHCNDDSDSSFSCREDGASDSSSDYAHLNSNDESGDYATLNRAMIEATFDVTESDLLGHRTATQSPTKSKSKLQSKCKKGGSSSSSFTFSIPSRSPSPKVTLPSPPSETAPGATAAAEIAIGITRKSSANNPRPNLPPSPSNNKNSALNDLQVKIDNSTRKGVSPELISTAAVVAAAAPSKNGGGLQTFCRARSSSNPASESADCKCRDCADGPSINSSAQIASAASAKIDESQPMAPNRCNCEQQLRQPSKYGCVQNNGIYPCSKGVSPSSKCQSPKAVDVDGRRKSSACGCKKPQEVCSVTAETRGALSPTGRHLDLSSRAADYNMQIQGHKSASASSDVSNGIVQLGQQHSPSSSSSSRGCSKCCISSDTKTDGSVRQVVAMDGSEEQSSSELKLASTSNNNGRRIVESTTSGDLHQQVPTSTHCERCSTAQGERTDDWMASQDRSDLHNNNGLHCHCNMQQQHQRLREASRSEKRPLPVAASNAITADKLIIQSASCHCLSAANEQQAKRHSTGACSGHSSVQCKSQSSVSNCHCTKATASVAVDCKGRSCHACKLSTSPLQMDLALAASGESAKCLLYASSAGMSQDCCHPQRLLAATAGSSGDNCQPSSKLKGNSNSKTTAMRDKEDVMNQRPKCVIKDSPTALLHHHHHHLQQYQPAHYHSKLSQPMDVGRSSLDLMATTSATKGTCCGLHVNNGSVCVAANTKRCSPSVAGEELNSHNQPTAKSKAGALRLLKAKSKPVSSSSSKYSQQKQLPPSAVSPSSRKPFLFLSSSSKCSPGEHPPMFGKLRNSLIGYNKESRDTNLVTSAHLASSHASLANYHCANARYISPYMSNDISMSMEKCLNLNRDEISNFILKRKTPDAGLKTHC